MGEELKYVQMTRWSMHTYEGSKQQWVRVMRQITMH